MTSSSVAPPPFVQIWNSGGFPPLGHFQEVTENSREEGGGVERHTHTHTHTHERERERERERGCTRGSLVRHVKVKQTAAAFILALPLLTCCFLVHRVRRHFSRDTRESPSSGQTQDNVCVRVCASTLRSKPLTVCVCVFAGWLRLSSSTPTTATWVLYSSIVHSDWLLMIC